jgi:hypothetical protein
MDAQIKWALGTIGGVIALAYVLPAGESGVMQPSQLNAYAITPNDLLWLSRAVEHEGAPQTDVARTLVNLFTLVWSRRPGNGKTLGALIRKYASPVNPDWFPNGFRHIKYAQGLTGAALKEENAAALRRQNVYSVQTVFSPSTLAAVKTATDDGSSWNEDWTDYAAPDRVNTSYIRRTEPTPKQNTFYTRADGWPGYVVHGNILVKNA